MNHRTIVHAAFGPRRKQPRVPVTGAAPVRQASTADHWTPPAPVPDVGPPILRGAATLAAISSTCYMACW
ncbi:MAG: hypothetical protein WAS21_22700 [Geminicoccaceae bacterium]